MSCFITPEGLELLRHGSAAPVWRALVTLENCVAVNAACCAVILLCVGCIAKKLCFWYEPFENLQESEKYKDHPLPRSHLAPFLATAAFAVVPQFAEKVTRLLPFLLSWVPICLSAAVVASLNTRFPAPDGSEAEVEDERRLVWVRLALAGALAAVGAWESPFGVVCAPFLLAITWFGFIRRVHGVTTVSAAWVAGFMTAFLAEPELLPDCPWTALMPSWVQVSGIVVFVFIGVMPLVVIRRFGENRWTLGGWTAVLLVFATITGMGPGRFALLSASERFVRHVLADVGERKLVIGDGIFDVLVDEYKPADVKRIGMTTVDEREFLVNLFGNDDPVTNVILLVSAYYDFAEMEAAAAEAHAVLLRQEPPKDPRKMTDEEREAMAKRRQAAFEKKLEPLVESLKALENFADIPDSLKEEEIGRARKNIRTAWKRGFGGLKLSATLLALDVLCGDRAAAESDALTALTLDREDPAANAMLGSIRLEKGQYDRAERYLRKGVKGGGTGAYNDLALLLVKTGRAAEAEAWARQAVAKAPDDWSFRETLVQALIALGRKDEARKELTIVEKLADERHQLERAQPQIGRDRFLLTQTPAF